VITAARAVYLRLNLTDLHSTLYTLLSLSIASTCSSTCLEPSVKTPNHWRIPLWPPRPSPTVFLSPSSSPSISTTLYGHSGSTHTAARPSKPAITTRAWWTGISLNPIIHVRSNIPQMGRSLCLLPRRVINHLRLQSSLDPISPRIPYSYSRSGARHAQSFAHHSDLLG